MNMLELKPQKIDPGELTLLVRFAPIAVLIGALAGVLMSMPLWDEGTITPSFWSDSLKIVGVSALPLVAIGVRLTRPGGGYQRTALGFMTAGFVAAVAVIMLCLHQLAVGGKDGIEPHDWQVTLAAAGTGVTLGALAVGVAAEVLDKIDED